MKSLTIIAGITLMVTIFSTRAEATTKSYSCESFVHAESGEQHDSARPSFSLSPNQLEIGGSSRSFGSMVLRLGNGLEEELNFCGGVKLQWGDFNFSFWDMISDRTVFVRSYCSDGQGSPTRYTVYFTTDQSAVGVLLKTDGLQYGSTCYPN